MFILGISCFYHDAAAALIEDGLLIAAAEEERFTRKKHDRGFPANAVNFCLERAGINSQDVDYVVFYEKPLVKFHRILASNLATFPRSLNVFQEAMSSWFSEKLWIKNRLMESLGLGAGKILFAEHHVSHAASAFFCSPFKEAAILTIDGVGEWVTATKGTAKASWNEKGENTLDLTHEIRFPHSLGLLYSAFTAFLGFEVNDGEYKVMGMAPYGRPTRVEDVYKVIHVENDGGFYLNMDYFSFHASSRHTYSNRFLELFGEPRVHNADFYTATTHPNRDFPGWDETLAQKNQYYGDIAASIQTATEEIILKNVEDLARTTGLTNLCLAGGVALNSTANGRILRESSFKEVFIQPAAGDSGGALGAALYAYHVLLGKPRRFVMEHAYWGKDYSGNDIEQTLQHCGLSYRKITDTAALTNHVAEKIEAGKVIGWLQGRFELGPRALGARSILADPRRPEMKNIVNTKIKYREPFRPFAPVILEEAATDYYEAIDNPERHYPFRFMLMTYPTRQQKHTVIPAVTHQGGTGRLQTIRENWNPFYYMLVKRFGEKTGVPVLLNTSFNLRSEPIVNSPQDAVNTFLKSGLDMLVMENYVVEKN